MVAQFDRLNNLSTNRVPIPINQFFDEMHLSVEQKEERKDLANRLVPIFEYMFLVATSMTAEEFSYEYLYAIVQRRLFDELSDFSERLNGNDHVADYIVKISQEIVNTTIDRIEDEYYTSEKRAIFIAENETNKLANYDDLLEAVEEGYTMKRWVTMNDNHVRLTHAEVEGKEIPINEYFEVGNSYMMYPCDMDADAEETCNCRCSVEYF